MNNLIKLIGATALLSAAVEAIALSPQFSISQRTEGETKVTLAAKALADSLRNPGVTKFRNVFLFKTGKDSEEFVSVCGEVNSQNGYGGMSGFEHFAYSGTYLYVGGKGIVSADVICHGETPRVYDTRDYTPELRKAFDASAGG